MKLSELARLTGTRVDGSGAAEDLDIRGAAGLDDAEAGHVTFLANPRYTPRLQTTRASAVFVGENTEVPRSEIVVLRARDPYLAYTRALRLFHPEPEFEPFVDPSASIDPTARLGEGVSIGACTVVGRNVRIGDHVRLYPNVTIYDDVEVGPGSTIHSGVAIREGTHVGARVVIHNNAVIEMALAAAATVRGADLPSVNVEIEPVNLM